MQRSLCFLAFAVLFFVSGCNPPSFRYPVQVLDHNGHNIANAKVTIQISTSAPYVAVTGSDGFFRVSIPNEYAGKQGVLQVEATGYITYRQDIDLESSLSTPKVVLLEVDPTQSSRTEPTQTIEPIVNETQETVSVSTATPESELLPMRYISPERGVINAKDLAQVDFQLGDKLYQPDKWDNCPTIKSIVELEDNAIRLLDSAQVGWGTPLCNEDTNMRVEENLLIFENRDDADFITRTLQSKAQTASWFQNGFELSTSYGSFWVIYSDFDPQSGQQASMIAGVDEAVIDLSVTSTSQVSEDYLSGITLTAIMRLREAQAPPERGELIITDPDLFDEETGQGYIDTARNYPVKSLYPILGKQPSIESVIQKYGAPDRIVEKKLTFAYDSVWGPFEVDAIVYYYGSWGLGIINDQIVYDAETLAQIKKKYGEFYSERLSNMDELKGKVIWIVKDAESEK